MNESADKTTLEAQVSSYRREAAFGDVEAALKLGLLLSGDSEVRDLPGAIDAYGTGIELGDRRAALNLGNLLLREPTIRDFDAAIEAYETGIGLGDPDSALNLGNFLRSDSPVRDPEAAAKAYRKGIELGDPRAAMNLGYLLSADPEARDIPAAIEAYRRAVESGDAKAAFNLGILFTKETEARDLRRAIESYREAVRLGDGSAALNLGHLLLSEPEVRDLDAAVKAYSDGVEMGEPECALSLGLMSKEQWSERDQARPLLSVAEQLFLARGWYQESEGRSDAALADYERAAKLGSAEAAFLATRLSRPQMEVAQSSVPAERREVGDRSFARLQDLEAFLESLPPPKEGHVRVFRGQRRNYGSLIPAGLRPGAPDPRYLGVLAAAVTRYLLDVLRIDHPEINDAPLANIWIWAITQHYGTGSPYLDVTRSLDVALWFALHDPVQIPIGAEVEALGCAGPDPAIPLELYAYSFEPASTPGYLYVLDVPEAEPSQGPWNSQLIDLAKAPKLFAESPRVQAQEACLILGPGSDQEDLSSLLVTEPLEVTLPMSGSLCGSMAMAELFPPPGIDEWYARLLAVPLMPSRDTDSGQSVLTQAAPVTLYGDDEKALRSIARRMRPLWPRKLFAFLAEEEQERDGSDSFLSDPDEITSISLHFPIRLELPDASGEGWNHGITAADVPGTAPLLDPLTGERGEVSVEKVFVEFSPLEHPAWFAKESSDFLRGAYLEREQDRYRFWFFTQTYPDHQITGLGPLKIEFDHQSNRFLVDAKDGREDLGQAPIVNLAFLTVLFLLRELASKPLIFPFPWLQAPGNVALVGFSRATAVLVEMDGSHMIYDSETQRPMGTAWMAGTVLLSCRDGWPAVDPAVAQQTCDDLGSKFPANPEEALKAKVDVFTEATRVGRRSGDR
jgi:TPR repeat protein